jgi:membrane protein DedA with SNARE-associated domain
MIASLAGEVIWATSHPGAGHLAGRGFRHQEAAAVKALAVLMAVAAALWLLRRHWQRRHNDPI